MSYSGVFLVFTYLGVGSNVSGKSAIFSPLKIGGGEGVQPDFGKIETKDRCNK